MQNYIIPCKVTENPQIETNSTSEQVAEGVFLVKKFSHGIKGADSKIYFLDPNFV